MTSTQLISRITDRLGGAYSGQYRDHQDSYPAVPAIPDTPRMAAMLAADAGRPAPHSAQDFIADMWAELKSY